MDEIPGKNKQNCNYTWKKVIMAIPLSKIILAVLFIMDVYHI